MSLSLPTLSYSGTCGASILGWDNLRIETDIASMERQNGSQLDADAVEPKTMAIARKKYPLALKPKAPVRLACICEKQKHALMLAVPRRIAAPGKEILVLYISVRNCNLAVPKVMGASLSTG